MFRSTKQLYLLIACVLSCFPIVAFILQLFCEHTKENPQFQFSTEWEKDSVKMIQKSSRQSKSDLRPFNPPLNDYEARVDIDFNIDRVYSFDSGYVSQPLSKERRIPKIIHFMWKNKVIPSVFTDNLVKFANHNPDWEFYFWTDDSSQQFLKDKYPTLLNSYKKYKLNVSRSDALRYAAIYHYGGAYFDLDTKPVKPLANLLLNEECIVSAEPMAHSLVILNMRSLLGNCLMLCKPRHSFFKHVLSELDKTSHIDNFMYSAGPVFFGNAFNSYTRKYQLLRSENTDMIHVMSSEYFLDHVKDHIHSTLEEQCPLYINNKQTDKFERDHDLMLKLCADWKNRGGRLRSISPLAYTVHLYFGSYSQKDKLDDQTGNHIEKLIPGVKYYPFRN